MAVFNSRDRIIECKLVYYGPGRGGKTTNLEYVFNAFKKNTTSEMVSINTKGDRTLFFDFLPLGLGKIRGCDVKVQLYTVPGQTRYASTRKMVLKGVDGVVFVADSLEVRRKANLLSLKDLAENLQEEGKNVFTIPLVLQFIHPPSKRRGDTPPRWGTPPFNFDENPLSCLVRACVVPCSPAHGSWLECVPGFGCWDGRHQEPRSRARRPICAP